MLFFFLGAALPILVLSLMNGRGAMTGLGLAALCCGVVLMSRMPDPQARLQAACAGTLPCAIIDVSARVQSTLAAYGPG